MKRLLQALVVAAVLLAACTPSANRTPVATSRSTLRPSITSPSETPLTSPSATGQHPLMLSALQRLNSSVGYLAAWPNTGPELAKTRDNGVTWQRLSIPVNYLMALRFIDEQVGWAAGFSTPQYGAACPKPAPSGAPPCQIVVLRTQDGGKTWQRS